MTNLLMDTSVSDVLRAGGLTYVIIGAFLIAALGYALGSIKIKGISLGTAGVFLVAILFGYLFSLDGLQNIDGLSGFYIADGSAMSKYYKLIQSIGLVLFVTSVGFIAGPRFFHDLKKNAKSYVLIGATIIVSGAVLSALFALIPGIGSEFSTGVLAGALTSTPGFSAAQGAAGEAEVAKVALGYAIAYPFGVVGVVLFVQITPKLLKANPEVELQRMRESLEITPKKTEGATIDSAELQKNGMVDVKAQKKLFEFDSYGLAVFAIAILLGIGLGSISIPISSKGYDGAVFNLGNTGGPLIIALIFGHFGRVGRVSLKVPERTLKVFREFGLMLFLLGAGVEGGVSLVSQISNTEMGAMIVLYGFLAGVVITIVPMIAGFFLARKALKIPLYNALGSICGGMTSTPALGTLIATTGTEDVGGAYASTYPIALILVVLSSNLIVTLI